MWFHIPEHIFLILFLSNAEIGLKYKNIMEGIPNEYLLFTFHIMWSALA
jgi:hypothetical protein